VKKANAILCLILIVALFGTSCNRPNKKVTERTLNYSYAHKPLVDPAFMPLPYGNIEAKGWLRDWALLTKEGLVNHNKAFQRFYKFKHHHVPDCWQ